MNPEVTVIHLSSIIKCFFFFFFGIQPKLYFVSSSVLVCFFFFVGDGQYKLFNPIMSLVPE